MNLQRGVLRDGHRHAAYQLTVSLDGKPHRAGPDAARLRPGLIHLVKSNAPHAFDGRPGEQALFWLAPESTLARRLAHTYLQVQDAVTLPEHHIGDLPTDELRAAFRDGVGAQRMRHLTVALLGTLSQSTVRPPEAVHPAVKKAVRIIRALETKAISAESLAGQVGLSRGRLLHVFKDHIGIPLRPYLQWLRCVELITLLGEGWKVTDAALAAGFADGAHANRVLKRYLALSPSALVSNTDIEVRRYLSDPGD